MNNKLLFLPILIGMTTVSMAELSHNSQPSTISKEKIKQAKKDQRGSEFIPGIFSVPEKIDDPDLVRNVLNKAQKENRVNRLYQNEQFIVFPYGQNLTHSDYDIIPEDYSTFLDEYIKLEYK